MLTVSIENTSGVDIVANDGVLPGPLKFLDVADTATEDAVVQVHDLDKVEDNHSGFTAGDLLQMLVQQGKIAVTFADVGATDVSVMDDAVATAA